MKKLKAKTFIILLPVLLGSLAGCVSNNSSNQGSNSSNSNSGGGNLTTATVNFWHTFGQTVVDGLKNKIDTFIQLVKQNEGIDVTVNLKYQGGYDDIATLISNGFSVNNIPTIAVAYPDNVSDYLDIGKSANSEFVVNLDKFINSDTVGFGKETYLGDQYDEDDFVEDFYREGSAYTVEGTYSLPFLKSTEIMFYNMDLLIEFMKGYKPELNSSKTLIAEYMSNLTWTEFMSLCTYIENNAPLLKEQKVISNDFEVPMYYDSDANYIITKIFQNNIPFSSIDTNGKGKLDFASGNAYTAVVDKLDEARVNFKNGLFTTKGIKKTYGSDFFTNEKCLFSIGSSGGSGYNFPQAEAFELGVTKVPFENNNPLYVSQGPTLALFNDKALSKAVNDMNQLYAWKFMKYITNGRVNAEICINGSEGYIPVRYSAYETSFFQEFMDEGERYAMCYKVIVNDINSEGGYLVSAAFKGSAALRDNVGTMLTAALNAANKEALPAIVSKAINDTTLKM